MAYSKKQRVKGQAKGEQLRKLSIYLCLSLLVLVMSWEYQQNVSASMLNQEVGIPEEAIRLRVLAHSDSPADQWLKREIRDVVVEQINEWVADIGEIEQAREYIVASMDQMQALVQQTVAEYGYTYETVVDFGSIPFPAKLYGNRLYPAGEYEGLLVTIGAGQGENWWCVLFPPLCFVDFGTGDAVETTLAESDGNSEKQVKDESAEKVEVRFFVLELWSKIKAWFA